MIIDAVEIFINYFELFTKAFFADGISVIIASIYPLGLGILLAFFASKNKILCKIFSWASAPFESVCSLAAVYFFFWLYANLTQGKTIPANFYFVIFCAVAFVGYMPARYVSEYSFAKNIIYYGLGLVKTIYIWRCIVDSAIHCGGLMSVAGQIKSHTYQVAETYFITFISCFTAVLVIELGRRVVKNHMK